MTATLTQAKEKLAKGVTKETTGTGMEQNVWDPPYAAAPGGPLPRVIDENERAIPGTARFKVRGQGESATCYVLAKKGDEAAARACYLKATGADKPVKAGDPSPAEQLSCRELAD